MIFDPLITDTSEFWKNYGEFNDVKTEEIQTEVFRLPTTCFVEEDGSIANSGRWLQWHWKGAEPPGEAKTDSEILSELRAELIHLYKTEGGKAPLEPLEAMSWDYANPLEPKAEEVAKENNGYALEDIKDADGNIILKKVSYCRALHKCVMMVRHQGLAGFTRDNGPKKVTKWQTVITLTHRT